MLLNVLQCTAEPPHLPPQRIIWPQMSTVVRLRNPSPSLPPATSSHAGPGPTNLAGLHQSLEIPNQCMSVAKVHINYISLASDGDTDQMLLLSPLPPHETRVLESKFIIQLLRATAYTCLSQTGGPGSQPCCMTKWLPASSSL